MAILDNISDDLFIVLSYLTLCSETQRRFPFWKLDHEKWFRIDGIIFKLNQKDIMGNITKAYTKDVWGLSRK
jgi:hypothetical protein